MKKIILLFTSIFLITHYIYSQDTTNTVNWYESTTDFLNNKISEKTAIPKIVIQTSTLLKITKFTNPILNKRYKFDELGNPWAIKFDSSIYFSFNYCSEIKSPSIYIKPQIIGRYCVLFADKETLRLISANGPYYGGGLTGTLIGESAKWGRNWMSDSGEKIKVFISDTKNLKQKNAKGVKNATWEILYRKNLNDYFNTNFSKDELDGMTLDKLKELIALKNNGS